MTQPSRTAETQPGEIGAIVRSLGSASRGKMMGGSDYGCCITNAAVRQALVLRGLVVPINDHKHCSMFDWTALGLKVRAALVEGGADD